MRRGTGGLGLVLVALGCTPDASSLGGGDTSTVVSGDPTSTTASTTTHAGADTTSGDAGPATTNADADGTADDAPSTGEPPPEPLLAHLGTFVAAEGGGTQMVGGVGFEPVAVLLWVTEHPREGVIEGGHMGRGWTDGSASGAVATAWAAGRDTVRSRWADDACITLVSAEGDVLAEASPAGMHDDGFAVEWTTPGAPRMVAFLALGGPIEARVGNTALSMATETIDVVGFLPDVVLLAGVEGMPVPGISNRGGHGFGVALPSEGSHASAHRGSPMGTGSSGIVDGVALATVEAAPTVGQSYVLVGVDFDGFGLNRQIGTGSIGTTWLALRGVAARGGIMTQPNAVGDQAVPLPFTPVVVMFDGGDQAEGLGAEPELVHGVAVGTGAQAALWMGHSGPSTETAWDQTHALVSRDAGGQPVARASVTAADASGFTLGWTTADDVPRQIGWLALGSAD